MYLKMIKKKTLQALQREMMIEVGTIISRSPIYNSCGQELGFLLSPRPCLIGPINGC